MPHAQDCLAASPSRSRRAIASCEMPVARKLRREHQRKHRDNLPGRPEQHDDEYRYVQPAEQCTTEQHAIVLVLRHYLSQPLSNSGRTGRISAGASLASTVHTIASFSVRRDRRNARCTSRRHHIQICAFARSLHLRTFGMSDHRNRASRKSVPKPIKELRGGSAAERKKHQSDLLDEGLRETFPASDPVSIILVE